VLFVKAVATAACNSGHSNAASR